MPSVAGIEGQIFNTPTWWGVWGWYSCRHGCPAARENSVRTSTTSRSEFTLKCAQFLAEVFSIQGSTLALKLVKRSRKST